RSVSFRGAYLVIQLKYDSATILCASRSRWTQFKQLRQIVKKAKSSSPRKSTRGGGGGVEHCDEVDTLFSRPMTFILPNGQGGETGRRHPRRSFQREISTWNLLHTVLLSRRQI
ncbi:hypothetical protein CDAR_425881, partial [Caerostris darwini]